MAPGAHLSHVQWTSRISVDPVRLVAQIAQGNEPGMVIGIYSFDYEGFTPELSVLRLQKNQNVSGRARSAELGACAESSPLTSKRGCVGR